LKHRGQLLLLACPFFTEIVIFLEMLPQKGVVTIVLLLSVTLTNVTPKVTLPQVHVEGVIVHIAIVAKLAQRVPLVGFIIRVPLPTMPCEFLTCVRLKLPGKEFQVASTDFTE